MARKVIKFSNEMNQFHGIILLSFLDIFHNTLIFIRNVLKQKFREIDLLPTVHYYHLKKVCWQLFFSILPQKAVPRNTMKKCIKYVIDYYYFKKKVWKKSGKKYCIIYTLKYTSHLLPHYYNVINMCNIMILLKKY